MSSTRFELNSEAWVRFDTSGRTPAFFCRRSPLAFSRRSIEELKEFARRQNHSNVRICLHVDAQDLLHEMIVLARPGGYYRPHKHLAKPESYHVLEGTAGLLTFDEVGDVDSATLLEAGELFFFRIDENRYHTLLPITDPFVYKETRLGPLTSDDSRFPSWAPDPSDPRRHEYQQGLFERFYSKNKNS